MWYTDLGNNNAGAQDEARENTSPPQTGDHVVGKFRRYHGFWFVPSTNGGAGQRRAATDLNLSQFQDLPSKLKLTAHQHTDLVFLTSLASKAASSSTLNSGDSISREIEKHYKSTTLAEQKIKASQSAFDLDELHRLGPQLQQDDATREAVGVLTRLELVWMLESLVEDFGWRQFGMAETVKALKVESTPADQSVDEERKEKATNMVFNPGQGQRKF